MISARCKIAVKEILRNMGLHFIVADLGEVDIMENLSVVQLGQLKTELLASGFELMDDKRSVLIEKIINVITEMIHYSDELPKTNYSDYISENNELNLTEIAFRLHYSSVAHLSNQFKKITGLSPSAFKQLKDKNRIPIEEIGNTTNIKLNERSN
jgi:hypothetical protein